MVQSLTALTIVASLNRLCYCYAYKHRSIYDEGKHIISLNKANRYAVIPDTTELLTPQSTIEYGSKTPSTYHEALLDIIRY